MVDIYRPTRKDSTYIKWSTNYHPIRKGYTCIMFPDRNDFIFGNAYSASSFNVGYRNVSHHFSCYIPNCAVSAAR